MAILETNMPIELLDARQTLAAALAAALAEPSSPMGQRRYDQCAATAIKAWHRVREEAAAHEDRSSGLGELRPDRQHVLPLVLWLNTAPETRLHVQQHVFGLVISKQCPAYETEYSHTRDATYRAHQMADIAGFYVAFGLQVDPQCAERVDHVAMELEFVAFLLAKLGRAARETGAEGQQHRDVVRSALDGFIRHHVAWWMPTFGKCLERRIENLLTKDIYPALRQPMEALAGIGRMVRAWSAVERGFCGVEPSTQIVAPQVETETDEMTCATCALSNGFHKPNPMEC